MKNGLQNKKTVLYASGTQYCFTLILYTKFTGATSVIRQHQQY